MLEPKKVKYRKYKKVAGEEPRIEVPPSRLEISD